MHGLYWHFSFLLINLISVYFICFSPLKSKVDMIKICMSWVKLFSWWLRENQLKCTFWVAKTILLLWEYITINQLEYFNWFSQRSDGSQSLNCFNKNGVWWSYEETATLAEGMCSSTSISIKLVVTVPKTELQVDCNKGRAFHTLLFVSNNLIINFEQMIHLLHYHYQAVPSWNFSPYDDSIYMSPKILCKRRNI